MPEREIEQDSNRLDTHLVNAGIIETRNKAQQVIKAGEVTVDSLVCTKNSRLVNRQNKIEVSGNTLLYVSRGGKKLEYGIKAFDINPKNKVCMDIGSSTGGFTDCLLKHGAKLVYAVDVGSNQLHPSLLKDKRIVCLEKTDIRKLSITGRKKMDIICVDVSFISLTLILPHVKRFIKHNGEAILLIKPQFEQDKQTYNKHGVIKNETAIFNSIGKVMEAIHENGFLTLDLIRSPVEGNMGNIEFLAHLKHNK